MDSDPIFGQARGELEDVLVEALDHVRADGVRALATRLPVWQGGEGRGADFQSAFGVGVQRGLQGWVGDGLADSFTEVFHEYAWFMCVLSQWYQ